MQELYWITTLSTLGTFCAIIGSIFFILMAAVTIVHCSLSREDFQNEEHMKHWKKCIIIGWVITIFVGLIGIFIPSERQMYLIYGVGGTLDYLKENPTAQQLPDKYIKVLDKIADEYLTEEKGEKK